MHLTRSNTSRSKSRSSAQPDSKHITASRPFLPPSHYAAAAGIPYNSREIVSVRSDSSDLDASFASKDSLEEVPYDYNAFMPVAYPTEPHTLSDSSFDFKASTFRQGDKLSSSRRSSVRSKRQSHITGLPLLEAQLLPSLRDTIDRMTRSPASAASSPSMASGTRLDIPRHSNAVRPTRSSSLSSDHLGSVASHSDTPSAPTPSSSPFVYPPPTPEPVSSGSIASVEPLTPRSKLPTKSALKSALRPPTPKLFSGSSPVSEAHANTHSGGVTLKSVRNILSRKLSAGNLSASPTPNRKPTAKSSKPDSSSTSRHGRKRSCTDPGSLSSIEVPSFLDESKIPVARYIPQRTPKAEAIQLKSSAPKSSIPRPQTRSPWSSRSALTEDSDVEYRYEADGRDRRKLVVANAEVFPSSSESDDMDSRGALKGKYINLDDKGPWHSARNTVGLGLDFGASAGKTRGRRDSGGQHQQEAQRSQQDDLSWSSKTPTLPAPTRGTRSTGKHQDQGSRGNARDSNADLDDEHRKRRAALLGIVSRLELGSGLTTPVAGESEESEYAGQEGFAISGSGELADGTPQRQQQESDDMGDDGSVYGDEDGHGGSEDLMHNNQRQDEEKPRSSGGMPTFLLSTDDSDDRIHSYEKSSVDYLPDPHLENSNSSHSPLPYPRTGPRVTSRSPIIRNENSSIPIPAALRRHSVYHRSPSPRLHPETTENMRSLNSRWHSTSPIPRAIQVEKQSVAGPPSSQLRGRTSRRDKESEQSDAVLIAERSHAAAAREHRAFGIPPSESVEVYQQRVSQLLSHAESNLSSVGSVYWPEEDEELSHGAETLFKTLSGKEIGWKSQSQQNHTEDIQQPDVTSRSPVPYNSRDRNDNRQDVFTLADHEDADQQENPSCAAHRPSEAECNDLEVKRQDLIRELCQTEEVFVNRLHVFVQLFILPLRVQSSKTWISGVPCEVARLFDWLEDIMNLHSQMLSTLQATRTEQYPVVERIAESIRAFISRFEVYQPYLVRLADVVCLIEQLVQDQTSDFGEFVDLQQGAPECDDWSFQMFLNEPVSRLAKYPDFFSRLLASTPKSHLDYLSTFSLVHSTDMIIHVLNEVKVREDEYDLIKSISVRIQGLPPLVQLATRERRLLHHGLLHLVNMDDCTKIALPTSTVTSDSSKNRDTHSSRSNKLAVAISEWDSSRRGRSESTSSSSTGTSFNSSGISSGVSLDTPSTACSTFFSSYRISLPDGRLNGTTNKLPASPSPTPRLNSMLHGVPVQVFVFTDLVVLTAPTTSLAPTTTGDWTLLKNFGIARILGVPERPEQEPYDPSLIALDVLPVDAGNLNRGVNTDNGSLTVLRFIVPNQQVPKLSEKTQTPIVKDDVRCAWISAFQQCFRYTLHSISLPPHPRYDPHLDLAIDTHQTVFSLLASGLPLPKSPSVQEADLQRGEAKDSMREEREERGWWSVRFQQVFRELQRQDMALLSVTTS